MKRLMYTVFFVLAAAVILAPGAAFAAVTVRVEDGARMREQPTTASRALVRLDSNCKVTLIEQADDWYKVSFKGQEGYVHKSLVTIQGDVTVPQASAPATPQPAAAAASAQPAASTAALPTRGQLQRGDEGPEVKALQTALKQLGYFNEDVTGLFGKQTQQAVKAFQAANGLKADGVAGKATLNKLAQGGASASAAQSSNAVEAVYQPSQGQAQPSAQQTLYTPAAVTADEVKYGDVGKAVKSVQQALANHGLFSERIDGAYGDKTQKAVASFQTQKGLYPDGVAGQATLELLGLKQKPVAQTVENASYSPPAATTTAVTTSGGSLPSNVELLDWNNGGKEAFVKKTSARVYDVRTGIVYYVASFSNGSHADVEPITTEDTALIKTTYNDKWDWDPRPIVVTINGRSFVGAINGQPHGGGTNDSNGMDGQLCIHLLGSRTHNGNREYESDMQAAVMEAWRAVGGR